jgi:hypothetical protein
MFRSTALVTRSESAVSSRVTVPLALSVSPSALTRRGALSTGAGATSSILCEMHRVLHPLRACWGDRARSGENQIVLREAECQRSL